MLPVCHHIPWLIYWNPHFPAPFPHQLARVAQNYPEQMRLGSHDSLQNGPAVKEIAPGLPHDPVEDWERARGELDCTNGGWCCQRMCNKLVNHLFFGTPDLATGCYRNDPMAVKSS